MHFKIFTTPLCPKCPTVKSHLENIIKIKPEITGEFIDASQPQGLDQARKYLVMQVPTIIFFDGETEKGRAGSIDEVDKIVN